jgi:Uma2 family endonuclease
MSVMTSVIPHGRPFTVDDLEGMPDDDNRYELIDGMLLVSPAPDWPHQEMGAELFFQLRLRFPPGVRVLTAPFAVRTGTDSEVQPDVLVACFADLNRNSRNLPVAPLLAVEVLSPSTRLKDLNLKKAHYERIGVASYWILDPNEPGSLIVFELDDEGRYQQVAHVEGDDEFVATSPFPVTIVPARLLDGLQPG